MVKKSGLKRFTNKPASLLKYIVYLNSGTTVPGKGGDVKPVSGPFRGRIGGSGVLKGSVSLVSLLSGAINAGGALAGATTITKLLSGILSGGGTVQGSTGVPTLAGLLSSGGTIKGNLVRKVLLAAALGLGGTVTANATVTKLLGADLIGGGILAADMAEPGPAYDADAKALFAAMTTPPDDTRKELINRTIVALKAAGIWSKLDALYVLAASNKQAALLNWITRGSATEVGAPVFTADVGYRAASATSGYINAGNVNGSGKYKQNDASAFTKAEGAISNTNQCAIGHAVGTTPHMRIYNATATAGQAIVQPLVASGSATPQRVKDSGIVAFSRTASTTTRVFTAGVMRVTSALASAAIPNADMTLLTYLYNGAPAQSMAVNNLSFAGWGSALTDTEQSDLSDILETYQHEIAFGDTARLAGDTLIAAMTTAPTAAREANIRRTIRDLVANGIWSNLDRLYMIAAHNQQAGMLNWIAPATGVASLVGNVFFTANKGVRSQTSSPGYMNPGYSADGTGKFKIDNAVAFSQLIGTTADDGGSIGGFTGSTRQSFIRPGIAAGVSYGANGATFTGVSRGSNPISKLMAADRLLTASKLYIAGAAAHTGANTATLPNTPLLIAALGNAGTTPVNPTISSDVAVAGWGASLTAAQHAALSIITDNYIARL